MICETCKEELPEEEFEINCGRYSKISPSCYKCRKELRRRSNMGWYETVVENQGCELIVDCWGTHVVKK
jgi:hypothetical protein